MSDGIGCVCAARSEYECCCDADWRPQELIDLQQQLASRDAEVVSLTNQRDYEYVRAENAEQERDQLREQVKMLRDVLQFYMDNGICEPLYHKAKEALASTEPRLLLSNSEDWPDPEFYCQRSKRKKNQNMEYSPY